MTPEPGTRQPVFCLNEVEILRDLDQQEMESIAARAAMRVLERGSLVWSPIDGREVLYIVKSGRVRLLRSTADGRTMTLAVLGPGALFGQMRLLGQDMRTSSAEAFEDVVLCQMTEADVRSLLLADPRIAARITEGLGRRLAEVEQRLADALLKSAPQRVAATVATLAGAGPSSSRLTGPRGQEVRLTHAQLADLVGTTRETTTKVLGDLQSRGLVALRRGKVVVLDVERLQLLSEEPL
ncbi:Crp/Fnr family transcriptional regulator [Aquipuribacter nitratireducens]|uniref:Crp/Fnr family transcriptional regulator n=1 Tax=Aquipuribacter nitratireducens TaxID=650104 RepID=A0ABW0GS47_9MICO